jgi:KAP family P-loop domain
MIRTGSRIHFSSSRYVVTTDAPSFAFAAAGVSRSCNGMLAPKPGTIPTVWFNPLYYRETSQVWAGLAHAILHQLAEQLPDAKQREEFWLRLQISRLNVEAVRRDVHLWLFKRAIPGFLMLIGAAAVLFTDSVLARWFGSASIAAAALHFWTIFEKRTLDRPFEKYISEPSYQSEFGLLHLVDHDLDRALRLLVADRPIAVFIDDLDRCDPHTVKQVVLAINQFLSLPNRNVYFFLGMDMEMVAASLEEAQRASPQFSSRRQSFGWRFMEKFVQLPFVIPHVDARTARHFAAEHLRGMVSANVLEPQTADIDVDATLAAVDDATAPSEIGRIARQVAEAEGLDPAMRTRLETRFSQRTTELMQDPQSDEIQRIVEIAVEDLDLNPRTIKRYFSLVRILRNIQITAGVATGSDKDRKIVLRAAHLLLNWPQFVQWLRNTHELAARGVEMKSTIAEIERIAAADSTQQWTEELKKMLGDDLPGYLCDPTLHRFLRKMCADRPALQELYDARMF